MFVRSCSAVVACLGISLVVPARAAAQPLVLPAHVGCPQCPAASPLCACTTLQPVVETRLRAEPALTVTPEPRIGFRPEAQLTSVPVTTFRNVTLDEGHYQTVWVPRPVTRQTVETVWQPELSYRSVPFVYSEPVAQWATRLVPEQTVRYVPQTRIVLGGPVHVPQPVVAVPAATTPSRLSSSPAWPVPVSGGASEYEVLPAQALVPDSSVKAPSAAVVWQTPRARRR